MVILSVAEVFVPGGLPKHTYVPRADRGLEEHLRAARDHLCKIATVTGATKSGKTVLVRTVFADDAPIWLDGGAVGNLTDFWEIVADQLDIEEVREVTTTNESVSEIGEKCPPESMRL